MTSTPSLKPQTEAGPLRLLLAAIVDYAGLFPPAELDMAGAAAAFDGYRRGEHEWMLGSFVVPLGGVEELTTAVEALPTVSEPGDGMWPASVIIDSPGQDAALLRDLRARYRDMLVVGSIEVRPLEAEVIRQEHEELPGDVDVFYEVALDGGKDQRLDAIAAVGAHAKVRTGGVKQEMFPSPAALAGFVLACADRGVPFKATAGLHHPFHGRYALTYEPESGLGDMHGFVELALVAGLVRERGIDHGTATSLLTSGGRDLELERDAVSWCGYRITADEMARFRRSFFRSFGSCAFDELIAELTEVGLF